MKQTQLNFGLSEGGSGNERVLNSQKSNVKDSKGKGKEKQGNLLSCIPDTHRSNWSDRDLGSSEIVSIGGNSNEGKGKAKEKTSKEQPTSSVEVLVLSDDDDAPSSSTVKKSPNQKNVKKRQFEGEISDSEGSSSKPLTASPKKKSKKKKQKVKNGISGDEDTIMNENPLPSIEPSSKRSLSNPQPTQTSSFGSGPSSSSSSSTHRSSSASIPSVPKLKSEKAKGKEKVIVLEEEEEEDELADLIHPDLLFQNCINSSASSSTSTTSTSTSSSSSSSSKGGDKSKQTSTKEKPFKSSSSSNAKIQATSSRPPPSSKITTTSSTSSSSSTSKKGKGKAKDNTPQEPAALFLSQLPQDHPLLALCTEKQVEMEKSSQVLLEKQKKIHAEIDETYRKRGKVGKGNQTGKKGKALKKLRNKRVDAVNASRSRLRSQQATTFESDRSQVYRMLLQNLDVCERSLAQIGLDDPLVEHLKEMHLLQQHKNFFAKTQTGLIWLLSAFDLRIIAGIAGELLASPDCVELLQQIRDGDPEWETTLESLPEVTPDMGNLLVYLLSSKPSDIDGPLPLAGSPLSEKIGISVDPTKRQLYGGSAFSGAAGINSELQEKGITKVGRVLEKVELGEGETAGTGGGARVHGEHLSQDYRLKIKLSQNSKPFIASSDSYKSRYGVPDDSTDAFTTALEEDSKTIEPNSDSKIPFDPSRHPPRAIAFVDNAPPIVAALMECLVITSAQLATSSTLYLQAADDLEIELPSIRPFEVRNKEIGCEDRTSSWFDPEAQRARGRASMLKQWEFDRPRMIARCAKGGRAGAARTLNIIRDRNLLAWLEGHESYLHWSAAGYGQRKPVVALKAVDEGRTKAEKKRSRGDSAALNATNALLDDILTPYPRDIPDSRSQFKRSKEQEARATALMEDHVPSFNKFTPLFPRDRDSIPVEDYDYQIDFEFRGKKRTYKFALNKKDLVDESAAARKWFTVAGCRDLDSLAVNLSRRLRKQEREGMTEIVDKFLEKVEVDYNSEEEDELEESDEEDNEDEDGDIEMDDEEE
ncbi:hypothetical protein JCM3765_007350 [Sporobolomyces pararoseus]